MQWTIDSIISIALVVALAVVVAIDEPDQVEPDRQEVVQNVEVPKEEPPPPLPQIEPPAEFVFVEPPAPEPPKIDPPKDMAPPIDRTPRLRLDFEDDFRAGLMTTSGNPDDPADDNKKLTYSESGKTNNTRLFVDGRSPELGQGPGVVRESNKRVGRGEYVSEFVYGGVKVTRKLKEIPGAVSRRMDAVRATYIIENTDVRDHLVALRVMLDTLIGDNDGVPFIVPGTEGIVTSPVVYQSGSIPDFVRALERPNLQNPGVIVDIGLRTESGVESPHEVVLSHWPGSNAAWDYDRQRGFGKDTAVGLYYVKRTMKPGDKRVMSYTYGLGSISSTRSQNARISLTAGGPFKAGGKFWLVALVQNPKAGQEVSLQLPAGISLATNEKLKKPVPPSESYSQISWLLNVAPRATGQAELKAKLSPDNAEESQTIDIEARQARLKLLANGTITSGGAFWLTAVVPSPLPGQSVELTLPAGLTLDAQHKLRKLVPPTNKGYSLVNWMVRIGRSVEGAREIAGVLGPDGTRETISVDVQRAVPMLKLVAKESVSRGKPFWVVALVQNPRDGQSVKLSFPTGVELVGDNTRATRPVPTDKSFVQIPFLVKSSRSGKLQFTAGLTNSNLTAATAVEVQAGSLVQ